MATKTIAELETMTPDERISYMLTLEPSVRDALANEWAERNDQGFAKYNSNPKTYEHYTARPKASPFDANKILYYVFNGETPLYICAETPDEALLQAGVPLTVRRKWFAQKILAQLSLPDTDWPAKRYMSQESIERMLQDAEWIETHEIEANAQHE